MAAHGACLVTVAELHAEAQQTLGTRGPSGRSLLWVPADEPADLGPSRSGCETESDQVLDVVEAASLVALELSREEERIDGPSQP
jgi:hypothetical protein